MSPERKREVFMHECLHMIEHVYRIKISEENISCIATALNQLLVNNKVALT